MIVVRDATEDDAQGLTEVYHATYGDDYAYPQFYDEHYLRKLILAENAVTVVAEESDTKRIVGTASVLEERGAFSDLVGEFGRLVVHPDARRQGIGKLLMKGRLERVRNRIHVGMIDARTTHTYSAQIAGSFGFSVVGYLPLKRKFTQRENIGLMAQYFENSLDLRRNHPHVIPEIFQLASLTLENCSLKCDVIVDEQSAPYPYSEEFELEELKSEGYTSLLRIERGRVKNREIFGPMRLHYGYFKLEAKNSHYLIAREGGRLVGAIGYTVDELEQVVQIFELITLHDEVVRFLFSEVVRVCRENYDTVYFEVDVSAYSPRMQRTLLELGFLPAAYIPARVFHEVERLDVVKMVRLLIPVDESQDVLLPETQAVADVVIRSFRSREVQPRLLEALDEVSLFDDLNEEQRIRLASYCTLKGFQKDTVLYKGGTKSEDIYLVLSGTISVQSEQDKKSIGSVGVGECLGEVSTLIGLKHTASARAKDEVETAILRHADLERLIRLRPDIGVILYKNLAKGLGMKLQRAN